MFDYKLLWLTHNRSRVPKKLLQLNGVGFSVRRPYNEFVKPRPSYFTEAREHDAFKNMFTVGKVQNLIKFYPNYTDSHMDIRTLCCSSCRLPQTEEGGKGPSV